MRKIAILVGLNMLMFGVAATTAAAEDQDAEPERFVCTVGAGTGIPGIGGVSFSPGPLHLGSCTLTDDAPAGTLTLVDEADGCDVRIDEDQSGSFGPIDENDDVDEGATLAAFCDAGTVDAENAIEITLPVDEA